MSGRFSLDGMDFVKILKGALIVGAAAVLTALADGLTTIDFGPWTMVIIPLLSTAINIARKFLANNADSRHSEPKK